MSKSLVIIDMLNDFVSPKGTLYVPGAEELVPRIVKLRKAITDAGCLTIYANDYHAPDDKEFKRFPPHCVPGTWGAIYYKELAMGVNHNYAIIHKQEMSFYSNPEAKTIIDVFHIDTLFLTGVATEYCIEAAALESVIYKLKVYVVEDCIKGLDEKMAKNSIETMKSVGVIFINSEEAEKIIREGN